MEETTLQKFERNNKELVDEKYVKLLQEELEAEIFKNAKLQFTYENAVSKLQELESQIEKMKTCENCKNKPLDSDFQDSYNSGYFDPFCSKCKKYSNWELKCN